MKPIAFAAVLIAAMLAGCDAVQVPGVGPTPAPAPSRTPEPTPPTPMTGPVSSEEPASDSQTGEASAQDTATDMPASINPDAASDATDTLPAPGAPDLVPEIGSLLEINARTCGLPAGMDETLTVAAMAGVTEAAEPAFGTATVNGMAATLANFPGIVKMEPRRFLASGGVSSGHCGATRIARNWFVTAAHCVDEAYDEIRLVTGSETLTSPLAKPVLGLRAICHAAYSGSASDYRNDIALIQLDDFALAEMADVPIARFGKTQKPLSPVNYPVAEMAGWGLTGFDQGLSNDLLSAPVTVTGSGPATLAVASRDGAGPCIGDSGGPLYVTEADGGKTVVGVLSVVEQNRTTGQFCSGDYGGRYTNLQGYEDWIAGVINACNGGVCQ